MTRSIVETLQEKLGAEKVLTDSHDLKEKRHDYWVLSQLEDMQGRGETYRAYEFDPKTVKTARPGKEYVLAVTTPGGLYRYVTGDVVTLTDGLHMVKIGHIEQQEMGAAGIAAQHMVLLREVARDELELNLGIQNQVVAVESEALNYLFGIR